MITVSQTQLDKLKIYSAINLYEDPRCEELWLLPFSRQEKLNNVFQSLMSSEDQRGIQTWM